MLIKVLAFLLAMGLLVAAAILGKSLYTGALDLARCVQLYRNKRKGNAR